MFFQVGGRKLLIFCTFGSVSTLMKTKTSISKRENGSRMKVPTLKLVLEKTFFQCGECFGPNLDIPNDARLLAMTGLKLKFVLELKDQYQALELAFKKSDALEIKKAEQN